MPAFSFPFYLIFSKARMQRIRIELYWSLILFKHKLQIFLERIRLNKCCVFIYLVTCFCLSYSFFFFKNCEKNCELSAWLGMESAGNLTRARESLGRLESSPLFVRLFASSPSSVNGNIWFRNGIFSFPKQSFLFLWQPANMQWAPGKAQIR